MEYESLFALGSLCGIGDPEVVLRASKRCDELGLDTISTGGTIAFAMECVERGWLDAPWLRFGDGDALLRAIDLIGRAKASATLLAEGSRALAHVIGHDSIAFAPQVKGLEIPGYEPRALADDGAWALRSARAAPTTIAAAPTKSISPSRSIGGSVTLDAVRLAIETEDKAALMDSLILCKFLRGVFERLPRRSRRHAAPRHRLGRRPPTSSATPPAHRRRQAAVQPAAPAGRRPKTRCPSVS